MIKLVMIPLLTLCACVLAAIYGAVHNQISFSVAPTYFLDFKFHQFNISPALPDRLGAALVGMQASWWMGALIGLPIALICAFAPSVGQMVRLFFKIAVIVVLVTLALGAATLLVPVETLEETLVHQLPIPRGVRDPVAFTRAGLMHDTSYLAGAIGLFIGLILAFRGVRRARRALVAPVHAG